MPAKRESVNGSGKMTKEEERFLLENSRQVTNTASALFYGNAFIVSVLPIWLYWRVQVMDPLTYGVFFCLLTLFTTWVVSSAYKKMKRSLEHKISMKRESAVSKEVLAELSHSNGKKLTKTEKDERIDWKKKEVAEGEATTFAIFYINTLFLFLILCAFYFLRSFHPVINYVGTTGVAGLVLMLLANGV